MDDRRSSKPICRSFDQTFLKGCSVSQVSEVGVCQMPLGVFDDAADCQHLLHSAFEVFVQ